MAALDYRSGEVELVDNAYAQGASEDDRDVYVLRQGALLRLSR